VAHVRFGRRPGDTDRSRDRHRAPGRPHLGTQVVDEVRRRVQQEQLGRRGHKHDPLYKIRGLLRHGLEHLSQRQHARLTAGLLAGDPSGEV
jgi:transposase